MTLTEATAGTPDVLKSHKQKITRLISRGLLAPGDRPRLMRALDLLGKRKDMARLAKSDRDILQRYNSAIENAALGTTSSVMAISRNINAGFEIDGDEFLGEAANMNDPPIMMVLKRKGVRIFPDGRRVALYVNEKLGLTFTIPYSSQGIENPMMGVNEESEESVVENLEHLKDMAAKGAPRELKFLDGTSMEVHHDIAKKILLVHNQLNDENKAKLADMLSSSKSKFMKVANFAHEKVKPMVPNA